MFSVRSVFLQSTTLSSMKKSPTQSWLDPLMLWESSLKKMYFTSPMICKFPRNLHVTAWLVYLFGPFVLVWGFFCLLVIFLWGCFSLTYCCVFIVWPGGLKRRISVHITAVLTSSGIHRAVSECLGHTGSKKLNPSLYPPKMWMKTASLSLRLLRLLGELSPGCQCPY